MSPTPIEVEATPTASGWTCRVALSEDGVGHRYTVLVSPDQLQRYGRGRSVEELVRATFHFLLAREPASSILTPFELAVVERYFPEYPRLI